MSIPHTKRYYKETPIEELSFNNPNEVWTAKIDGAHSVGILKKGELPRLYSYRQSKKTGEDIEYTPKLPHIKNKSGVDAVVRLETWALDRNGKPVRPEVMTSLLNSKPERSLEFQKNFGLTPKTALIDIDSYKGKDTTNLPFPEKQKIMEEIIAHNPEFHLPDTAKTPEEKKKLFESIQNENHYQTREGIVKHFTDSPYFEKAKFTKTHDVYIREIHPEESPTGREPMAGSFSYSIQPNGPIVGKVGTGFTHGLKEDLLRYPQKYIGRVARVLSRDISPRGVLLKPSFVDWDIDRNIGHDGIKQAKENKEFAPGLPEKETIHEIPSISGAKWDAVLQHHIAERAGSHYDFRLGDTSTGYGHSWALPKGLPTEGVPRLAIQQGTHTIPYFDFEGEIKEGYGKGTVKPVLRTEAHIHEASPDKIKFDLGDKGKYTLINTQGKNWLMIKNKDMVPTKIAGDIKEELSDLAHTQWSGWVRHMLAKGSKNTDGTITLPENFVARWERQLNTKYDDLSEDEKNSDRREAQKVLDTLGSSKLANKALLIRQKMANSESDWNPIIKDLGKIGEADIKEVDGYIVRSKIVDFTLGGHHYVYPQIPENQIWVERVVSNYSDEDLILIAKHEANERLAMKYKNISYEKAHAEATKEEKESRKEQLPASEKEASETIKLPELHKGDTILGGKFKNIKMDIEGTSKDENNQPVIKTDKGDIKAFKFRIDKLMKEKTAGGPGSGGGEVRRICVDYPQFRESPIISIGKRKEFFETHTPSHEDIEIPVKSIKFVGQQKYVPEKLQAFIKGDKPIDKPIKVIEQPEGIYHVADGHHRLLACVELGIDKIHATVYTIDKKEAGNMEDEIKTASLSEWIKALPILAMLHNPAALAEQKAAPELLTDILSKVEKFLPSESKLNINSNGLNLILDDSMPAIVYNPLKNKLGAGLSINF